MGMCRGTGLDFIQSWCRGGVAERQRVCRRHFLFSVHREPQRLAVCARRCRRARAGAPRGACSATGSLASGSGDGASVVLMYSLRVLATGRHELAAECWALCTLAVAVGGVDATGQVTFCCTFEGRGWRCNGVCCASGERNSLAVGGEHFLSRNGRRTRCFRQKVFSVGQPRSQSACDQRGGGGRR